MSLRNKVKQLIEWSLVEPYESNMRQWLKQQVQEDFGTDANGVLYRLSLTSDCVLQDGNQIESVWSGELAVFRGILDSSGSAKIHKVLSIEVQSQKTEFDTLFLLVLKYKKNQGQI